MRKTFFNLYKSLVCPGVVMLSLRIYPEIIHEGSPGEFILILETGFFVLDPSHLRSVGLPLQIIRVSFIITM